MGTCRNTGSAKAPGSRCADCQCGSIKIDGAPKPKREKRLWSTTTVEPTVEPAYIEPIASTATNAALSDPSDPPTGCEKSDAPGCQRAVCCQELKKDDQPTNGDDDML